MMSYNATSYTFNNVSAVDYYMLIVLAFILLIIVALFFFLALRIRERLDRYRLKYGFDRELEAKDINQNKSKEEKEHRLNEREKFFRKRVLRD